MNEKSKSTLKKYNLNQVLVSKRYYSILLIICVLINIGLVSFIYIYKIKISQIKNLSINHSSNINFKNKELSRKSSSIDHKIMNIAALSLSINGNFRFSINFENSDEFNNIKTIIYNYLNKSDSKYPRYIYFLYQSGVDSDEFQNFMENISYFINLFICIQTEKGITFGIFINKFIKPDNNSEFEADTNDIFLYLFKIKKIYNFKGDKKKSLSFKRDKLISLGDDELVIFDEYWVNGGYIKYPFKSFDLSDDDVNSLTEQNGEFYIKYLEIFSFA